MASAKIKKGDNVVVLTGKDKGRTGKVIKVLPTENRVAVMSMRRTTSYPLVLGSKAIEVVVRTPDGEEHIGYDALVLAPGAVAACPAPPVATRETWHHRERPLCTPRTHPNPESPCPLVPAPVSSPSRSTASTRAS